MQPTDLTRLSCEPCRGDTPPLTPQEAAQYLPLISSKWEVVDNLKLRRTFAHRNFLRARFFVNAVAYLAEQEDHHPDITVSYSRVTLELTTHAIHGLSRNDFIVAAKVDALTAPRPVPVQEAAS